MKKIFTLFAAMLLTVAVNAEDQYPDPKTENSLSTAVAAVQDGETVWLTDGTYFNVKKDGVDYVKLRSGKQITIRAIAGKSPVIKLEVPFQVREAVNAKFIGVKFDGTNLTQYSHLFDMYDATDNVLEFEDCEFTNISVYIVRVQKERKLKKVTFNKCYIHDNSNRLVLNEKGATVETVVKPGGITDEIIVKDSRFKNITSYPILDNYDDDDHTSGGSSGSITITGCEFTGLAYPVIHNSKAAHIGTCVIDDCYFHDNKRCAVYIEEPVTSRAQVDSIAITNSTFANYTEPSGYYSSIIDIRNKGSQTALGKVLVDHCTFYDCRTVSTDHTSIRVHKSTSVVISNCIFVDPTEATGVYERSATHVYGGVVKNCIAHNYIHAYATQDGHWPDGATYSATSTSDPLFVDAAHNNFMLAAGSPAIGAATDGSNLGDPHWNDRILYLQPNNDWKSDGAKFAIYCFGSGSHSAQWAGFMTPVPETDYYIDTIPAGYSNVIFARINGTKDKPSFGTDTCWNKSPDLEFDERYDLYVITGWNAGHWASSNPTLEDGYYLVGTFGGDSQWDLSDLSAVKKFAFDSGDQYKLTRNVAVGDEFKVRYVEKDALLYYYPSDGPNYSVTQDGNVTIYFKPGTGGNDWYYKCIYVYRNGDPTSIGETIVSEKAVKVIRNGQLFIEKDGKTYNVLGTVVK